MTAQRKTEERELIRQHAKNVALFLFVIAVLVFVAYAPRLFAQSHHPADQLYIPVVYHTGRYSTELTFTNFTADRVRVSLTFIPVNTKLADPEPLPIAQERLAPGQSLTKEIGTYGVSGQGMLILNVCREFGACGYVPDPSGNPNAPARYVEQTRDYRDVSVSARVYWTDSNGGTRGDSMTATSWRVVPGIDLRTLSSVSIVGIRVNSRYRTRIGMVNGSQFAATCLTATLYTGKGVKRGERTECVGPLEGVERSAEEMFPDLVANRLNRGLPIVDPWVRVTQSGVVPNEMAKTIVGCEDGCPRFDVYASVSDSTSGDFWFERSTFEPVLPVAGVTVQALRASAKGVSAPEPQCSVVGPDRRDGSYLVLKAASGQDGVPWDRKAKLPWLRIAPNELTVTRAFCSGALEGGK